MRTLRNIHPGEVLKEEFLGADGDICLSPV